MIQIYTPFALTEQADQKLHETNIIDVLRINYRRIWYKDGD
jgi:hypothetical protein